MSRRPESRRERRARDAHGRGRDRQTTQRVGGISGTTIGMIALAAVVLGAGLIFLGRQAAETGTPIATRPAAVTPTAASSSSSGNVLGSANAPVTVEEWSDFQ